mgnify:CR=1 FL=1
MEKGHTEKATPKKHTSSAVVAGRVAAKKKTKTASDFAVSGMFMEKGDYKISFGPFVFAKTD